MDENLKEKYEKLANLIFPDVTETVEDLEYIETKSVIAKNTEASEEAEEDEE